MIAPKVKIIIDENENSQKPPSKVKMSMHWNINSQSISQNRQQYILNVLKIPFVRELLHNKQIRLCHIDPFIMLSIWFRQTKNILFELWNTEPEVKIMMFVKFFIFYFVCTEFMLAPAFIKIYRKQLTHEYRHQLVLLLHHSVLMFHFEM